VIVLGACKKPAADTAPSASVAATAPSVTATASASAAPTSTVDPSKQPKLGADAPEWKLVAKPTAADVTKGDITGSANLHKFDVKQIYIEPGLSKWTLVLADQALDKPTGFLPTGAQSIKIDFSADMPAKGKKYDKALKYGDGYFQVAQPKDPTKTTSWNADNSFYVELTAWDVQPYDAKKMFQEAGKASGKVYVAYKGFGDFKNSGVAGEFKDAVVRYMGEPFYMKKKK
jgi:hypothetical protein